MLCPNIPSIDHYDLLIAIDKWLFLVFYQSKSLHYFWKLSIIVNFNILPNLVFLHFCNYTRTITKKVQSQAWHCMTVIPALRLLRQEDHWDFKINLNYINEFKPSLNTLPIKKKDKKKKHSSKQKQRTKVHNFIWSFYIISAFLNILRLTLNSIFSDFKESCPNIENMSK